MSVLCKFDRSPDRRRLNDIQQLHVFVTTSRDGINQYSNVRLNALQMCSASFQSNNRDDNWYLPQHRSYMMCIRSTTEYCQCDWLHWFHLCMMHILWAICLMIKQVPEAWPRRHNYTFYDLTFLSLSFTLCVFFCLSLPFVFSRCAIWTF